ncbi:MAG TPA: GGDEF domain-containing protein [Steroidobacteraceae bacterium]|nr:GGDEF domain-containing protein [Steroidobacteraceae bacterium]
MLVCVPLALAAAWPCAAASAQAAALLERADALKLRDPREFGLLIGRIGGQLGELSEEQREYLLFLQAWKSAYDGKDSAAIAGLSRLAASSRSEVIRFRAYATLSDLFTAQRRYHAAFQDLSEAQKLLPRITDARARTEGLLDAAELYGQVGQYQLALDAAQAVIDQNRAGEGACMGGQQKLHSLFNSGRFAEFDAQVRPAIESCLKISQPAYANEIRVNLAARYIAGGRPDAARRLLEKHYTEVRKMGYSRLIVSFDALLALACKRGGDVSAASRFASDAVRRAIPGEYPRALIAAYRILYQLARQRGDYRTALADHEQYTIAKIGYLNDVSARQLAYEKVSQENMARKLEVQALSRKNRLLELEHRLAAKEVEATRLYVVILTLIAVFVGLWALKTKRSQLRFMSLSRLDGLTGISNRLHFIEQAEAALTYARKSGQEVSLMLFDLDYFKSVNDRLGHAAGDFVLKRAASLCNEYLRRSDLFGRFGGEEFSILLPACRLEAAREQAEQLRQAISGIQAEHRGVTMAASASFGIASTAASGYDLARLLAHADSALYRAKRAGRNCVMAYDVSESGELQAIVPPPEPGSPSPQA